MTNRPRHLNLRTEDGISGCLLAGALGDAIGRQFENQNAPRFCLPDVLKISDDTQLTLATCESIVRESGVVPEAVARQMTKWFREGRLTGLGASTLKSLTELNAGGHWAMVGATGELSAGNGAAMRVAPLAFFLDPLDDNDRRTIRDVCRITHRNDEAYLGALSLIFAILHPNLKYELVNFLIDMLPDSRTRDRFIEIKDNQLTAKQLASRYSPNGYVVHSVPVAILIAIESKTLMDGIEAIVDLGGDTDTIGSMFGHIFGARNGTDCLPSDLVERLEEAESISELAVQLTQL